jgi:hypothetical protein
MMNKDYNRPSDNAWTTGFVAELKAIKTVLYTRWKDTYPQTNQQNPISSCVNKLLCDFENQLLQTAIQTFLQHDDDCVPMFDGFMCSRLIDVDELNSLTQVCGVRWAVKEWTKRTVPDGFDAQQTGQDYETTKTRFEKKFFIVKKPLMFNYDGDFVSEHAFRVLSKTYKYQTVNENGQPVTRCIFEKWISDDTHRCYTSVSCEPYNQLENDPTPDHVYNEALKFPFEYIPDTERDVRAMDDLKHILHHLTTEPAEAEYLIRFIADIIQFPRRNPQILIVFKGHAEGIGKDTINKTLQKLLGHNYVASVGDMKLVFGNYNPVLDGKLVLQFNECQSKQGHSNWDPIKDQVTADKNCIREKYLVDKWQPNYTRLFVSSNNPNPIPAGRRPFMCQTRIDKKISPQWFDEYYNSKLTDTHYINSLGSYLLSIDLANFNVMKPPLTEVHLNKHNDNIKPIHRFLQKLAEGEFDTQSGVFKLNNHGLIGCKKKWLVHAYKTFHEQHFHTDSPDQYKKDITNWANEYVVSITLNAKPYLHGKQLRCVQIDTHTLIDSLKNGNRYTESTDEDCVS